MARIYLAAITASLALPVFAQSALPTTTIQPSVDSAERRQVLRDFTECLAETRPRWARRTLAHPYLSDAQAAAAAEALNGRDKCIKGPEVDMTFRTSAMVGSLAEYFVRSDMGRIDSARLAVALAKQNPLNVSEDFALCVASRNPSVARDLAISDPGSPAEIQASETIARHVGGCINDGEKLTVDLQSLRALTSTALYRGMTTAMTSDN